MLLHPQPLSLAVKPGIVGQPELHRAPYHRLGLKTAVGLSHNLAVDAARLAAGAGTVVLHRLLHYLYLLIGEPAPQTHVGSENPAARDMVDGTRPRQSQVVIGGNDIHHVDVGTRGAHQVNGTAYHRHHMTQSVRLVEVGVLRQDVLLHKLYQIKTCRVLYHKKTKIFLQIYEKYIIFANPLAEKRF